MLWRTKSPRPASPEQEIADLEKLPPVAADFTTPEGAILCLESAYVTNDFAKAVACRDFTMEARCWLRERGGFSEKLQREMLPELTKAMERSFRQSMQDFPLHSPEARSYFVGRSSYGDGLVMVSEITVGPDRSLFRQRILTSSTTGGWRVVTPLIETSDGWRVTRNAG